MLFISPVFAQEDGATGENLDEPGAKIRIAFHRENYILPYVRYNRRAYDVAESEDAKFQYSLKLVFDIFSKATLNAAITQRSFWQVYDGDNSRPFRENNYNPEAFIRWGKKSVLFDLGAEHISNGEEDPESRSINMIYGKFHFATPQFRFTFKSWFSFGEEDFGPEEVERKEKMKDFLGFVEISLAVRIDSFLIQDIARYNWETHKGYHELRLLKYIGSSTYFGGFYTRGYLESLRYYNVKNESIGFGILINP